MKRTWVFLLVLVPSQAITAQVLSTRLSGMGYVSVAVPDVESEAFLNPARAMRVANAYARMSPLFLRSSEAFEDKSIQYPSNPRHYQRESLGYGFFMPVEILIPFGSFVVGGLLSYRSGNSKYALNYDYIDSDIPSLTTFYDAVIAGQPGLVAQEESSQQLRSARLISDSL